MKKALLIIVVILCFSISLTGAIQSVEATATDFPIRTAMSKLSSSNDPSGFKILVLRVSTWTMLAVNIYHSIYYSIDGQINVSMPMQIIPDNSSIIQIHGTIIGEATLPTLANGSHNVTIYVQTTCSNPLPYETLLNPSETLYFTLENQPEITPSSAAGIQLDISIESPNSSVVYGDTVPLIFNVSNYISLDGYVAGQLSLLWLGYSLDGASIVTIMDIPDTGWLSGIHPPFQTTSLNISGVPDGQHRIEVIARGYCTGIIGVYEYNVTSTPSYFTVDTTNSSSAPNPTASTKSTPTSPSSTPTQNPTQTASPILTPSPSPTPIIEITPSSSVPEFTSVFIVSFLMVTILAGAIVYRKKLK